MRDWGFLYDFFKHVISVLFSAGSIIRLLFGAEKGEKSSTAVVQSCVLCMGRTNLYRYHAVFYSVQLCLRACIRKIPAEKADSDWFCYYQFRNFVFL